jgi:hypothetical protein
VAGTVATPAGGGGYGIRHVAVPLAAALAIACVPAHGPMMDPGSDCLGCHTGGGGAKPWTVAGTIYDGTATSPGAAVADATVRITDANGRTFERRTNDAGNFYTAEGVAFPIRVCVSRHGAESCMQEPVPFGSCNVCHGPSGVVSPENHVRLFPIDTASKHAGVACTDCHGAFTQPAPASFRCAQCHLARDAALATNHTANTSNPAVVVSDFSPTSDACLRCHADAQVSRTIGHPSGFEGTPPHNGATCLVCHDAYRQDEPWGGDFTTDPRSWPIGSGHGCLRCHAGGPPAGGG